MSTFTVRNWVTIGLFGALWGAVEIVLGSYLHLILPPQTNTFFTGVLLGGIGVAVALTGRHFVPKRGSVFFIGVVTALLKLLSPGGIKIGPIVAILVEGVLMEIALWTTRTPRNWAFMLGGALAIAWNLPHKFVMMRLLFGKGFTQVFNKMVQDGSQSLGLDASAAWLILSLLLLIRLIIGAISGWSAWKLGGAVARRLGQREPATG